VNIADKHVVTFHYTLRNEQGEELEGSRDGEPSAYLHGANNLIAGLEAALAGHSAGDTVKVTLQPEDAYGHREANREQKVPVKHLLFEGRLRPGMLAHLNTNQGQVPVTVTKIGRHSATVDTNHPLAGQALAFEVEILDVRAASEEEIEHGHAHGVGGHHH
jgi:FKBP-type peptidyl-prolyl cis-trans isomerase SlyD